MPVRVGAVDSFAPDSITYFSLLSGHEGVLRYSEDGEAIAEPGTRFAPARPRLDFYVTRTVEGDLLALLVTDPVSACQVLPTRLAGLASDAPMGEPCFRSEYDLSGKHLAGPLPRDLARLPLRIEAGQVIVTPNLDRLTTSDGTPYRRGPAPRDPIDASGANEIAPGEVRSYVVLEDGGLLRYSMDGSAPAPPPNVGRPVLPRIAFHLSRTAEGAFIALDPTPATRSECPAEWRSYPLGSSLDVFREGCGGAAFDIEGRRVFGPAARDLDRLPIEVRDGRVYVTIDPRALIEATPAPTSRPGTPAAAPKVPSPQR